MILSNLAKNITLDMDDKVNKWKTQEFPPNYKSITDTLKIWFFSNSDIQIQVVNVFKNIKKLKLNFSSFIKNSA